MYSGILQRNKKRTSYAMHINMDESYKYNIETKNLDSKEPRLRVEQEATKSALSGGISRDSWGLVMKGEENVLLGCW